MSARNFYQTLYQSESLFRIADESWETTLLVEVPGGITSTEEPETPTIGLLAELDALSVILTQTEPLLAELVEENPLPVSLVVTTQPVASVVIPTPEALAQPLPRPIAPSVLPPAQQQARLPQLNHKVLLLADEELDPSNLLFLEKILKAVNLNIDGVDLLNLHGVGEMDFAELLRGKSINHFITFGVPFERIHLDIMMDRYAPVRFEGITFLMADSLPTIEADQVLKKRLWGALQRVFLR